MRKNVAIMKKNVTMGLCDDDGNVQITFVLQILCPYFAELRQNLCNVGEVSNLYD